MSGFESVGRIERRDREIAELKRKSRTVPVHLRRNGRAHRT
jgi:hypothetical protein